MIHCTGPLPSLFPFSPHWPVRQICRGHSGLPVVNFERAAALTNSALAGNVSKYQCLAENQTLWLLLPHALWTFFSIREAILQLYLYDNLYGGITEEQQTWQETPKGSSCIRKPGMELYKSLVWVALASLNS